MWLVSGLSPAYDLRSMRDAELQLIIASCRTNFKGEVAVAVDRISEEIDWTRVLALSRRHRVQGLCWHGLAPIGPIMPAAIAEQLQRDASSVAETNLRIAAESARLLKLFRSENAALLFLKGLTLGALAYRDPFRKMGWDIDLLIAADRLAHAARLLRSAGYSPITPAASDDDALQRWHRSRKESVWHHADGGFDIDLHTRLADHPALLLNVGIQSPTRPVQVAKGIELPTLGKDELFAHLAVHGASSAWFRLKWITDFAALLHGESADEIERLYARSQQLGAGRAAAQALLLAEQIYGTGASDRLHKRLRGDPVNRWLERLAERQLAGIREPTERLLGTAAIHYSQPFLLPGWRFKASEVTRQLGDIVGAAGR